MEKLTYNEWQRHLARELQKNYLKLKLIRNVNIRTVPQQKPKNLPGV
jgi:hypothetical protein